MNTLSSSVKAYSVFLHRVKDLQADGYQLQSQFCGSAFWCYRFLHRNGHRITLTLDTHSLQLTQKTNGNEVTRISLRQY